MIEWQELEVRDSGERRNQRAKRARVAPHRESLARQPHLVHRLLDLLLHPLRGKSRELGGALHDRVPGIALDVETEPSREPDRAQRAQAVLAHPVAWISDGANELPFQILASLVGIPQLVLAGRIGDRVDGVIAAGEIVVERRAELDDRVPAIRLHIFAESRHLVHDVVVVEDSDRPELDTHGDRALEELPHVGGLGGGGEIPVEVGMTEERVADSAADAPGLEKVVLEVLGDAADGLGWVESRDVARFIGFWSANLIILVFANFKSENFTFYLLHLCE